MDVIYEETVLYFRKGKWRNCILQIVLVRRCQDKVVAIVKEVNDGIRYPILGYECNNDIVCLIGVCDILRIKFDELEFVSLFIDLISRYIKDVSFLIRLSGCNPVQSLLRLNDWYSLHVQTNRICLTTDHGNRLVTRWERSNIGEFYIEDSSLNIEIIYKNEKFLYSFSRDEQFPLEKIHRAIKNLKFEFPIRKSDKLPSTPRRSGSVDLRRQQIPGNIREKMYRCRTYSSSRSEDTISNDDSSPPLTPYSPLCTFAINEPTLTDHIDEKDEECDDLMFSIDSTDAPAVTLTDVPKTNGYVVPTITRKLSVDSSSRKLVDLERFPFESDLRNQGKLSPELNTPSSQSHQTVFFNYPNIQKKSPYYATMDSLKHHRKTSSEANFVQHQIPMDKKGDISHSADLNSSRIKTLSTNSPSNSSSPLHIFSSGNLSSATPESSKEKDSEDYLSNYQFGFCDPLRESNNGYYNMQDMIESNHPRNFKKQLSLTDDCQYYNLSNSLSQNGSNHCHNIVEHLQTSQDIIMPNTYRNTSANYVELDFQDYHRSELPKKTASEINYVEIGIRETQVLQDLDNTIRGNIEKKKKSSRLFKSIFKK